MTNRMSEGLRRMVRSFVEAVVGGVEGVEVVAAGVSVRVVEVVEVGEVLTWVYMCSKRGGLRGLRGA